MSARSSSRLIVLLIICSAVQLRGQEPPRAYASSDIQKRVERLSVLGSVLYVAAHPDDENTAFLATMVNGQGVRTAYLSLTRGEGGQNLIGPEKGSLLGMIRTHELLAARDIDGAEQFFTRAIDFGYSKTTDETLRFWGREDILADLVRIIRTFRPDVIVLRFTPDRGGHGNHTASADLALEAFRAAGDPTRFPDQLQETEVWSPTRIVWNVFRFRRGDPAGEAGEKTVAVDLGTYDPTIGMSYTELAGKARSMHKSQGFGASESRGTYVNLFEHLDGTMADRSLFDGIDITWNRIPKSGRIVKIIDDLETSFDPRNPPASLPLLFTLHEAMRNLPDGPDVRRKIRDVEELIVACSGLWIDATTGERSYVRGDSMQLLVQVVNRMKTPVSVAGWSVGGIEMMSQGVTKLTYNETFEEEARLAIPDDQQYSQPHWLRTTPTEYAYRSGSGRFVGVAEIAPERTVKVTIMFPWGTLAVERPVRYRTVDPVKGELSQPIRFIPRVTASFADPVVLFPNPGSRNVTVTVTGHAPVKSTDISLRLPEGWDAEPERHSMTDLARGEQRSVRFRVTRTQQSRTGMMTVSGSADGEPVRYNLSEAHYDHLPPLSLLEEASSRLVAADVIAPPGRIGYIMGAGDEVHEGLRQIGFAVTLLSDEDIISGDLRQFDAIMTGVRAYNTRTVLQVAQRRLHEYMEQGGTYLVQYFTTSRDAPTAFGPYPLEIGRDRVTDERATMIVEVPEHPVFTVPNKISSHDFDGWVQERGLYFAQSWDSAYSALLAARDPGEPEARGMLLVADVGKGAFIYTGLSFFRQIPAGVPGAFRLLANLLSYRGGIR